MDRGKGEWVLILGWFRWGLGWIPILMGFDFYFLLWIFVFGFWISIGWTLDSDGIWVGFGLVSLVWRGGGVVVAWW